VKQQILIPTQETEAKPAEEMNNNQMKNAKPPQKTKKLNIKGNCRPL